MYNDLVEEENFKNHRDFWPPLLVAVLGISLSLVFWALLVTERREQILHSTRETAVQLNATVEGELEQQIEVLQGLTEIWSRFGLRPVAEWTAHVDHQVDRLAGLDGVAWLDLDEPRNRMALGTGGSTHEIELDADDVRRGEGPYLSGPERDASGTVIYRIFLPASTREGHAGVLVARFRVAAFLSSVFEARAPGYALSVFWEGEEIFSRGTPSADPWQQWWRVEEAMVLPLGGEWKVVYRPTPALAAARLTVLPHYLLVAGVLLSIVLAVVVHQLRMILRQSRFLAATNRTLEQRGLELEAKVAERTQALEAAVTELKAFNYSVSHDLRSPLGAILNFAAILEEDFRDRKLDPEGMKLLARIRRSASRATELLEDLLRLSRAGRAALTLERVDMTALARETFAQVRAAEGSPEVEFLIDPLPETAGDRALLGDVFANLFSNALKYSRDAEKPRITVTGRIDDEECIYDVADNGRGFDMRFAEKLFGLFERLHSADEFEGTGVGLAIVARIVGRHGGRVGAEGQPGAGARFSFALPRRAVP